MDQVSFIKVDLVRLVEKDFIKQGLMVLVRSVTKDRHQAQQAQVASVSYFTPP